MSENGMMSTGEVRAATGASRARLRYWETRGIVCPVLQAHGSRDWRMYPADHVDKVRRLMTLIGHGFSLAGAVSNLPAFTARESRLAGNAVAEATAAAIPARAPVK